ncbi:hypothetical protein B0H17DRAFT_1333916 [Mycena rosella]|uniref:Uncharacterized protein n=1 Tax=Mycena rosella TaxID=1033263 RepID=A0AAD7D5N1_MYCRO|nr:hypothetical protein B0H17DRAFT_1333916 [Mycena rosella]
MLPNDSIPFLPQRKPDDADSLEKDVLRPQARRRTQSLGSKLMGWPALVVLGQLVLQALGWGFFGVVKARGEVPLSDAAAIWASKNTHLVTLFATLIATLLASFSSFLFSYAVRRSIAISLYRPMSLETLRASVGISMRSIVFHRRDWKWPTVSLFVFVLAGIQTSGWSTLLTPVGVVISTPLSGSELDLSSPILGNMDLSGELYQCIFGDETLSSLNAGQTESGYAAANAYFGYPSLLTAMDQTFNVSTGGIFPAMLEHVNATGWFPTTGMTTIPPIAQLASQSRPVGLSTNYSMIQQGFTADISCSFQNLTDKTTPDLEILTDHVANWTYLDAGDFPVTYMQPQSNCPVRYQNLNWTNIYTSPAQNYLALLACTPEPEDSFTLIIAVGGVYDWLPTTVCKMIPKVTTLTVDYGASINVVQVTEGAAQDIYGPASVFAIHTMTNIIFISQGRNTNGVGIQWESLKSHANGNETQMLRMIVNIGRPAASITESPSQEQYFQGMTEYTSSVLRACLSGKNATFPDGAPPNMTTLTHGTFRTQTLGWVYASGTTRWALLPGTFIAFATIAIVLLAVVRHAGDIPEESDPFDVSNPLHLIAAAAAGGLNNTFLGMDDEEIKAQERLSVLLMSIPGRGPAFVRSEEYRPVPPDVFPPELPLHTRASSYLT